MKTFITIVVFFLITINGDCQASSNDASFKAYNNYDFIAGENILFEDNFLEDKEGEFPEHWNLEEGQAVINRMGRICKAIKS